MYAIHPSVIMNISEHYTRIRDTVVIGALLGKKEEIIDSFELKGLTESEIDASYISRRCQLIKQVSPDLDLIGWYSTVENLQLHDQIIKLIPNSIFLRFDPDKRDGLIPIYVYEYSNASLDDEYNDRTLQEVKWTLVTDDVEIIGLDNAKIPQVDNLFNSTNGLANPSMAIDNLASQRSAVKMLKDRVKLISKYIKEVQSGKLPYHRETVIKISDLCNRFPLMNTPQYSRSYNIQCNDVALNTYLGILTNGSINKMHFGAPNSKARAFSIAHARR